MTIPLIAGQPQAKRMLHHALQHEAVSHAYLFYGPKGTGKYAMALAMAQALFCPEADPYSCGVCVMCRRIRHGNHPDVYSIEPEGSSIKMEQIRQLQKNVTYRASESVRKVYILKDAERMTVQAANSLLKFLEEPSPGVTAILLTENRHALLPTILSRVQWVPFFPIPQAEVLAYLKEQSVTDELARAAVQIVAGMEEALQLCHSEGFAHVRNVVIQLMKETLKGSSYSLVQLHEKWFKSEGSADQHNLLLDLVLCFLRDLIHVQQRRTESVVYIDQLESLQDLALRWPLQRIVQAMEEVIATKKRLRAHANPQLAMERLWIKLQEG
jgi:DNA polymerase-3 subunit delta'